MTEPDPKTVREIAREAVRRGGSDSGYGFIGSVISDHAAMDEMLASGDRAAFGRLHAAVRAELKGAAITVEWPDEQQQPFVADADTPVGRIGVWLTAWKRYFGTLGLPFGADLIAGPPPSAEPRVSACDFDVVLEVLAVVLAERARSAAAGQQQDGAVTAGQQQDGAVDLREHVRAWMDGRTDTIDRDDVREIYVVADRASRDLAGAVGELRRVLAERTALAARVAELESEREADTRAVVTLLRFGYVPSEGNWMTDGEVVGALRDRFADRIAALDATETEES